jgi:5-formyltetrahydrofolate cyclo-ligase
VTIATLPSNIDIVVVPLVAFPPANPT